MLSLIYVGHLGNDFFFWVYHFHRHVKPFTCKISYRSEKARATVEHTKLLQS